MDERYLPAEAGPNDYRDAVRYVRDHGGVTWLVNERGEKCAAIVPPENVRRTRGTDELRDTRLAQFWEGVLGRARDGEAVWFTNVTDGAPFAALVPADQAMGAPRYQGQAWARGPAYREAGAPGSWVQQSWAERHGHPHPEDPPVQPPAQDAAPPADLICKLAEALSTLGTLADAAGVLGRGTAAVERWLRDE